MGAAAQALDVVVRFSSGNPDIVLRIEEPARTTVLSLKSLIRAELPSSAAGSRLRLIHAGKVLADTTALSKGLNAAGPPPPRDEDKASARLKGKQPVRDAAPAIARVYIHCSTGDALTPSELAAEARQAEEADAALVTKPHLPNISTTAQNIPADDDSTTPAPRGFDRLLSAGFTSAEVAALRTQFLAIQSHTHTPDTMPSGPDLLALEESWLDNGSNPAAGGGAEDTGGFGSEDAGGLEDMLYGNLLGFFWPMGAMFGLMREDGVWSRRRQIAVLSGFLVNITFGFLRIMN